MVDESISRTVKHRVAIKPKKTKVRNKMISRIALDSSPSFLRLKIIDIPALVGNEAGYGISNHRPVRDDAVFGDDDDAVADVIERVVHVVRLAGRRNHAVVSDAGILVDDRVLNARVRTDADARAVLRLMPLDGFERFVVVAAQHDGALEGAALVQDAA